MDFRNINKVSPKDDFPFPHIDILIDSIAGHAMLSFMDGFSGYNQIMNGSQGQGEDIFYHRVGHLLL